MLSFYTNAVQPERGISGVHVSLFSGKLPAQLVILVALSLSTVVLVPTIHRAHAQATTLTIQPPNQGSLAVGATFKFNVTVTNTPFNFAGWDITVVTNPAVLSPQSIADCNTSTCNAPYSDSGGTNFMPGVLMLNVSTAHHQARSIPAQVMTVLASLMTRSHPADSQEAHFYSSP